MTTVTPPPERPTATSPARDDLAVEDVATIDRRLAVLRERIRATHPQFARLLPGYWRDVDSLLDLRLWLTALAADRAGARIRRPGLARRFPGADSGKE